MLSPVALVVLFVPGFLIWFGIECARNKETAPPLQKKLFRSFYAGLIGIPVASLFCCGLGSYVLDHMSVEDHFSSPLTYEQAVAAHCPLLPSANARNIRFGTSGGGFPGDYEYLCRYEYPLADCQDLARRETFKPLTEPPLPIRDDFFGTAPWFDIENIRHGVHSSDGYFQTWIDLDRGVVYELKRS